MKKEIINPYEIKLEFNHNTENPSRLFQSFADMIDSVTKLDTVLALTVNTTISSKIYLDDINKGSLIAKLWNALTISEDGKIDDIEDNQLINEYVEEARAKSLEFISKGNSSVTDLESLSVEIIKIAKEKKLDDTFNYTEPNLLELASSINAVNAATDKLNENEKYTLTSPSTEVNEIKQGTTKIDIEDVENALTKEEIINETEVYYKIKKPDFLGDSKWEFKHGNKTIIVKILHEEWLTKFHNGTEVVVPGDSLKVKIKQTCKYNKNGYLISDKTDIIEVLEIKHNAVE